MVNGQTFTWNGNRYKFDRYFQYASPANSPKLISAKRWIKSKRKFSGVSLLIGRAAEIEILAYVHVDPMD